MTDKVYHIFSLTDPRTEQVYYYGCTQYPWQQKSQLRSVHFPHPFRLRERLQEIVSVNGQLPEFSILETFSDSQSAVKRVQELIDTARFSGIEILNKDRAHYPHKTRKVPNRSLRRVYSEMQYKQAFEYAHRKWIDDHGYKLETKKGKFRVLRIPTDQEAEEYDKELNGD